MELQCCRQHTNSASVYVETEHTKFIIPYILRQLLTLTLDKVVEFEKK